MEDALAYLAKNKEPFKQDLIDLASIPSISSLPPYSESCLEAAQWLEKRLTDAGLEASALWLCMFVDIPPATTW